MLTSLAILNPLIKRGQNRRSTSAHGAMCAEAPTYGAKMCIVCVFLRALRGGSRKVAVVKGPSRSERSLLTQYLGIEPLMPPISR